MLRVLILTLMLAGCATSSPPQHQTPTTTATTTSTENPPDERRPRPPSPPDWFDISLTASSLGSYSRDRYPTTFSYRGSSAGMLVTFHNAGEEALTAPTINFQVEQREPSLRTGTELQTYFAGADGEGWNCDGSAASITCQTTAEVAPGTALPSIEIELKALNPESGSDKLTAFTASVDDLRYEATLYRDTST